jgi:methanogenic corrinoid protein MtbC1
MNDRLAVAQTDYEQALLRADRRRCAGAVRAALDADIGADTAMCEVVTPALYAVGRCWASGELTVADEHLMSAIAEVDLARLRDHLPAAPSRDRRVVVAVADGEQHRLGARIVADLLGADGWHTDLLGSATPNEVLVDHVRATRPVAVGVSASTEARAAAVRELVLALRELDDPPMVLLGGRLFAELDAGRELVADLGLDPQRSQLTAARMVLAAA